MDVKKNCFESMCYLSDLYKKEGNSELEKKYHSMGIKRLIELTDDLDIY